MMSSTAKPIGAFKSIGEIAEETGLPQHILRYWETRFPQLRPLQRAGNRRYYRPADAALVHRINWLLNQEGYTVKGVQKLLASGESKNLADAPAVPLPSATPSISAMREVVPLLTGVRERLARALAEDDVAARV